MVNIDRKIMKIQYVQAEMPNVVSERTVSGIIVVRIVIFLCRDTASRDFVCIVRSVVFRVVNHAYAPVIDVNIVLYRPRDCQV